MIFFDRIFSIFGDTGGIIIFLMLLALSLLWIVLPIFIFQIKDRLNTLIKETQKTNTLLSKLNTAPTRHQSTDQHDI